MSGAMKSIVSFIGIDKAYLSEEWGYRFRPSSKELNFSRPSHGLNCLQQLLIAYVSET